MADLLGRGRGDASGCCCVLDHTRRGRITTGIQRRIRTWVPRDSAHVGRRGNPARPGRGGTLARVSTDPKDRWHELGSFIREQRGSARLSLRRLSELAGISNPYLSQIERGLRRPSAEILQQIAKALRISAETLYVQAGILEAPVGLPRPDPGHHGRPDDQRGAEAGARAHLPLVPPRVRGRARPTRRPDDRRRRQRSPADRPPTPRPAAAAVRHLTVVLTSRATPARPGRSGIPGRR